MQRAANLQSWKPWITWAVQQDWGWAIYQTMWGLPMGGKEEQGLLAKEWTWLDDTTLSVTIYDYIYDTDGNHMTAEDIKFSFTKWKEAGTTPNTQWISEMEVTGEYDITFKMSRPYFFGMFWGLTCFCCTQAAFESSEDGLVTMPVGSGPYKLRSWTSGSSAELEQHYNYWQKDHMELVPIHCRPHVDVIHMDVISEATQRVAAIETDMTQLLNFGNAYVDQVLGLGTGTVFQNENQTLYALTMNMHDSVLADNKALRQAICYAIDADSIMYACTNGYGFEAKGFGYGGHSGFNDKWVNEDYYSYNIEKAKEKMVEAGYPDGGVKVRLQGQSGAAVHESQATIIQECLKQIGIEVELYFPDGTTYTTNRMNPSLGEWDLCLTWNKTSGHTPIGYNMFFGKNYEWGNQAGCIDDELQTMILTALKDPSEANLDALHYKTKDDAYIYFMYGEYILTYARDGIEMPILTCENIRVEHAAIFSPDYDVYD